MTQPTNTKETSGKSSRQKNDWPELEPSRPNLTPEQALALEKVKQQAINANKLLINRSKAILITAILSLLSVIQNALIVIPGLLDGRAGESTLLLLLNMLFQLLVGGYLLRAKDPLFASQTLRLMLILNGVTLFLGLSFIGIVPLTLLIMAFMFAAYKRLDQLKYGGE